MEVNREEVRVRERRKGAVNNTVGCNLGQLRQVHLPRKRKENLPRVTVERQVHWLPFQTCLPIRLEALTIVKIQTLWAHLI